MPSRSCRSFLFFVLTLAVACAADESIPRIEDERRLDAPELVRALAHGPSARRARAALAMGRIQSAAYAVPLAEAAAAGGDREVRLSALFALGQLGLAQENAEPPREAFDGCRAQAMDADAAIAAAAVECLGKLATSDVPQLIRGCLAHPSPSVRAAAAHALFRCRFVPLWREQTKNPPPLPAEAVEALARALDDREVEVRRMAAHACSRYGEPTVVAPLVKHIGDADEWVRVFSVRAVGRSGDRAAAAALARACSDGSARVRSEAVGALAALGARESIPPALVGDPDFHVRAALARGLAGDERPGSLEILNQLEQDASPTVRAAAIGSLAERLDGAYDERLARWLDHADWRMRAAAAATTGKRAAASARALADADARVRVAALEALAATEGQEQAVLSALESGDLAVRGTAVAALEKMNLEDKLERVDRVYRASSGTEWVEVREALVGTLAGVAAEKWLKGVAEADPAPSVRVRARRELTLRGVDVLSDESAKPPVPSVWLEHEVEQDSIVSLETSKGTIRIRVLAQEAPIHVASFVERVRAGFYDGLSWHRVVSNFVVQGGDPRGDGWGGTGTTVRDEIGLRPFVRGAVGMPKAGKDTGSCQIFITLVPTPHLDGNYTQFGVVEEGMDVVDRLEVGDAIVKARVEGMATPPTLSYNPRFRDV